MQLRLGNWGEGIYKVARRLRREEFEDRYQYLPISLGLTWFYNDIYMATEEELMDQDADERFNSMLDRAIVMV